MLLVIDIGNTETTIGMFGEGELRATWHMATDINRKADEYAAILLNLLQQHNLDISEIKDVAMCSVVPPLTATFKDISYPLIIVKLNTQKSATKNITALLPSQIHNSSAATLHPWGAKRGT